MNIFKSVICHDYTVLRAQKRAIQLKTNGLHMVGMAWVANILSIAGLVVIYYLASERRNELYDLLFELHYWEVAGRVGIMIMLALIYFIPFAAFGGKANFLETIQEFAHMPEKEQKAVASKGGNYFYFSLLLLFLIAAVIFYLVKVEGL